MILRPGAQPQLIYMAAPGVGGQYVMAPSPQSMAPQAIPQSTIQYVTADGQPVNTYVPQQAMRVVPGQGQYVMQLQAATNATQQSQMQLQGIPQPKVQQQAVLVPQMMTAPPTQQYQTNDQHPLQKTHQAPQQQQQQQQPQQPHDLQNVQILKAQKREEPPPEEDRRQRRQPKSRRKKQRDLSNPGGLQQPPQQQQREG